MRAISSVKFPVKFWKTYHAVVHARCLLNLATKALQGLQQNPAALVAMTADDTLPYVYALREGIREMNTEMAYLLRDARVLTTEVHSVANTGADDAYTPRRCRCAWRLQLRICEDTVNTHPYYRHVRRALVGNAALVPTEHPDFYSVAPGDVSVFQLIGASDYATVREYWYGYTRRRPISCGSRAAYKWLRIRDKSRYLRRAACTKSF